VVPDPAGGLGRAEDDVNHRDTLVDPEPETGVSRPAGTDLTEEQDPLRAFFEAASDPIVVVDPAQNITQFNRAAEELFGWTASEVLGHSLTTLIPPEKAHDHHGHVSRFVNSTEPWHSEPGEKPRLSALRKNGQAFPAQITISKTLIASRWHGVALVRDLSDRTGIPAGPGTHAHRDPVTGLHDRIALDRYLDQLARTDADLMTVGLFLLDIDDFTRIRESAGDDLLRGLAARLTDHARPTDFLARVADDRFVLITTVSGEEHEALRDEGERLRALCDAPFPVGDRQQRVTVGIGAAAARTRDPGQIRGLPTRAGIALRSARHRGAGRTTVHDVRTTTAEDERELSTGLNTALADREFFLTYQPIVHLSRHGLHGFEALLRWNFQQRLIPPDRFIPLAERQGQLDAIGGWALEQACDQTAGLSLIWGSPLQIAVNLSPGQLRNPGIVDRVASTLDRTGLAPDQLTLEVTENALFDEDRAEHALRALKSVGVRLALDDFGTGFSSLTHLRRFPLDTIKIDGSFLAGIAREGNEDRAIIASLITRAHSLGLTIVIEGVETDDQARTLTDLGADDAQGYLFGHPMLPDQALEHCQGTYGPMPRHPGPGSPLTSPTNSPAAV
jgi:PAS domain S-box-containing protein/diguanylate cyclase (GGDEF)-like protein